MRQVVSNLLGNALKFKGSAEVFRDEAVTCATRIWTAGGQAGLHDWVGGFHGFDAILPQAAISQAARQARTDRMPRTGSPLIAAAGPT